MTRQLNKKIWPYRTKVRSEKHYEIFKWCVSTIGDYHDRFMLSVIDFDTDERLYYFKDEESMLMFKLRWSSEK